MRDLIEIGRRIPMQVEAIFTGWDAGGFLVQKNFEEQEIRIFACSGEIY